jgi:primase-polymerase (primpol)-like protein
MMAVPNFANIPQELKRNDHWVLWKTIIRAGKPTKVPYQTSGAESDSTDPNKWSPYADVVAAYQKGGYDGIGYVFDALDPYAGIDLDDCLNADGSIKPKAQAICESVDSYSEISPSGKGIKIFLKAKNPVNIQKKDGKFQQGFSSKKPELEIEIYYGSRFFTLTGNQLDDYPPTVEDRNSVLTALFKSLFRERGYFGGTATEGSEPTARDETARTAISPDGGRRFTELLKADPRFAEDFTTPAPVGRRSDVEFNLCARLWEAGIDEGDIYLIMNSSPQTKWGERDDDYRRSTIRNAVARSKAGHRAEGFEPEGPTVLTAFRKLLDNEDKIVGECSWNWRRFKPRIQQVLKTGYLSPKGEEKAHKFLKKFEKPLEELGIDYDNLHPLLLKPKDNKEEFTDEIKAKALEILRTGNPVQYVADSCGRVALGAETAFKKLTSCVSVQNITQSSGLHPKLTGTSSGGKTWTLNVLANHLPKEAYIKGSMSAKSGFYHKDGNRVLRLLDDYQAGNDDLDTVIKQTSSEFHEPYSHRTVVKQLAKTLEIGSEQTWAITSVNNDQDIQVLNRSIPINVDDSVELTAKVNNLTVKRYGIGEAAKLVDETVLVCRAMFQILRDEGYINVRVPFWERIEWVDTSNRRNPSIFMDLVIAHTAMLRYQRAKDSEGYYLATEEDFQAAKALFTDKDGEELVKRLSKREREVLDLMVKRPDGITRGDVSEALNIAPQQVTQILNGQKGNSGLLQKIAIKETKVSEMMRINDEQSRTIHKTVYSLKDYDRFAGFDGVVRLKPETDNKRSGNKEESKEESNPIDSRKEEESKESKNKNKIEEREREELTSPCVEEKSTLSCSAEKITSPTFLKAVDSDKLTFLSTFPVITTSPDAGLADGDLALFERIKGRLEAMNSEVTPFKIAIGMKANGHDIGLEACRALLEAGA